MKIHVISAWCGPVFVALLAPIWWYMGFLPPLSPQMSPVEVAQFYANHRFAIRFGATMIMQLAMLYALWAAAISTQIRRTETDSAIFLAYAQLALGAIAPILFVIPSMFWTFAAFRPELDVQLLYLINDMAWLSLVMPVMSATIQAAVIGYAIISDKRKVPLYPRWAAYFNFWAGITFLPGGVATFFKSGPFAWNGIFDFWIPLVAFSLWICVMAVLTARAARISTEAALTVS
jgi:hypothetical protein